MDCPALAHELVSASMRCAFGIPGGGPSLQLVDALSRNGVRFITTGHETTAALMAAAASRAGAGLSAAIVIKGPGLMNLAPGLLSNAYEGYPMLSIAEAYPSAGAGARRHKWLPHGQLLGTFAKGVGYWNSRGDSVAGSWDRATAEFPGPVHLELADGPGVESGGDEPIADDPLELFASVRAAQRPALVVGSVALRAPWRGLLERLQIPIFTTVAGKGAISELSRFAAGIYTGDGKAPTPEKVLLPEADLLLAIGVRAGEVLNTAFPNARCIRIDTPAVRDAGVFPPSDAEGVQYLSAEAIRELLQDLERRQWGEERVSACVSALAGALDTGEWSAPAAYQAATAALPEAVHVLDTGNFTVVGEHVLRVKSEQEIVGTPNGRYMGFGIGYALGTAVARPDRRVVLWIGDGGIRAFFSELSLAVANRLDLLVMAMCDGYFGSIRGRAIANRWTIEPLRMQDREIERIAAAMGLDTHVCERVSSLEAVLKQWRLSGGPALIRCNFDPDTYARAAELLR